jgi:hypothetical protein
MPSVLNIKKLKRVPPSAVYIGRANPFFRVAKSKWHNQFEIPATVTVRLSMRSMRNGCALRTILSMRSTSCAAKTLSAGVRRWPVMATCCCGSPTALLRKGLHGYAAMKAAEAPFGSALLLAPATSSERIKRPSCAALAGM